MQFQIENGEEVYVLTVKEFGNESCCTKDSQGKTLYNASTNDKIPMSRERFYGLLGRNVEVFSPKTNTMLFFSQIQLKNNDDNSTLVIPYNGVTQYSEDLSNYFYVQANIFDDKKIKIELLSTFKGNLKFKCMNIETDLLQSEPFLIKNQVYSYFVIIEVGSYNDYRWLGAKFEISKDSGALLYKDIFAQKNPHFNEKDQITDKFGEFVKFPDNVILKDTNPLKNYDSSLKVKVILGVIILTILLVVVSKFIYDKRKEMPDIPVRVKS